MEQKFGFPGRSGSAAIGVTSHEVSGPVFGETRILSLSSADDSYKGINIRGLRRVGDGHFYLGPLWILVRAEKAQPSSRQVRDQHDFVSERMADTPHGLRPEAFVGTVVGCPRVPCVRLHRFIGSRGEISIGANPGRPAVALRTRTRNAVVIKKELRFEFVQVRNFEPPASNAPQQGAQHGFSKTRWRGKDDVPEIDFCIGQYDAKHARPGGIILIIFHNSRQSLFVDADTPDFDGLADVKVAIHDDGCAVVADVNGVAFTREILAAFRGS